MSIKKLGTAIAISAFCSGVLLSGSVFAEGYSIQIEDADFYAALKTCAEEGISLEEFEDTISYGMPSAETLNSLYCDFDYAGATLDDETMSVVFESEEDVEDLEWLSMPNMGLKSIKDVAKFTGLSYGNFINNELSDASEIDALVEATGLEYNLFNVYEGAIIIAGNKFTSIPSVFMDRISSDEDDEASLMTPIFTFSMFATNQSIEDEYSGDSYTLPGIIADITAGFDKVQEAFANGLADAPEEEQARMQPFVDFFKQENWLVLENATLSEDGTTLTAIDPAQDMTISYQRPWTDVEEMLNTSFGCTEDDNCTEEEIAERDEEVAAILAMLKAFHDDDDQASIVTIKLTSTNVPETLENPETSDNATIYTLVTLATITVAGATAITAKSRR